MQLMDQANFGHAKASCYRCGQTSPVIDFDAHIEGEGGLCICRGCVAEAAGLLGFVSEGEGYEAAAELARLREQKATVDDIIAAAGQLIRSLEQAKAKFAKQVPAGV